MRMVSVGLLGSIIGFSLLNIACSNRYENKKNISEVVDSSNASTEPVSIDKIVFLIENSGSMLGFVKNPADFNNTLVSLSYFPAFDKSKEYFYFVNGTDQVGKNSTVSVNFIGKDPEILKSKLNLSNFNNTGDPRFSDLTRIFEIALDSTKNSQCTIVVSDCIYDVGQDNNPLLSLKSETEKTEKLFRDRLKSEDIQTIIIKASSNFDGVYYYASQRKTLIINQKRPYYIIIFGNSNLLNEVFTESNLATEINNFEAVARYLLIKNTSVPYMIAPSVNRKGSFKPDYKDNKKIIDAKPIKGEFQFSIAIDFSKLAFYSEKYLTDINNYSCSDPKFTITSIQKISQKVPGIKGSHLITLFTDRNPTGNITVTLKNAVPGWISQTNIDNENSIDSDHTYGFKLLTEAISNAYQYENTGQYIASFQIIISK